MLALALLSKLTPLPGDRPPIFESGTGREAANAASSFSMVNAEARLGVAHALFLIGKMHEMTQSGQCDLSDKVVGSFETAVECYREAARKGDRDGMIHLARMLACGLGCRKSFSEALQWLGQITPRDDTRTFYDRMMGVVNIEERYTEYVRIEMSRIQSEAASEPAAPPALPRVNPAAAAAASSLPRVAAGAAEGERLRGYNERMGRRSHNQSERHVNVGGYSSAASADSGDAGDSEVHYSRTRPGPIFNSWVNSQSADWTPTPVPSGEPIHYESYGDGTGSAEWAK